MNIFGCSAFGLNDSVYSSDDSYTIKNFLPENVILPETALGEFLTGEDAKENRIQSGFYWPPEARISDKQPLRRVPIPLIWRALVEAEDRMIFWHAKDGLSFSFAKILVAHINGLLKKHNNFLSAKDKSVVLAIPDNLDEFAQEYLITELMRALNLKRDRVMLVWRPIAAALAWIDVVGEDFIPQKVTEYDHIHVIYLGPDALEFATFKLKVWKDKNELLYVVPVRERPSYLPLLTGINWAGRIIEEVFNFRDESAFWQTFINSPEVWSSIANFPWNKNNLPRLWNIKEKWVFLTPPEDLNLKSLEVVYRPCLTLKNIVQKSYSVLEKQPVQQEKIKYLLREEIKTLCTKYPKGRVQGIILCGPLMSKEIPVWLKSELDNFVNQGLKTKEPSYKPKIGGIWICPYDDEIIAKGAYIYGYRLLNNIPTYLDTLPQLYILAKRFEKEDWISLVDRKEIRGGDTYTHLIEERFKLLKGQKKLAVYLKKGEFSKSDDVLSKHGKPKYDLSRCEARLIREIVRQCGSLKNVLKLSFFKQNTPDALYGLEYAKNLYSEEYTEINNDSKESPSNAPYRKAAFNFPSVPSEDVPLDILVKMKPASGLAQIEIKPKNPDFLKKKKVFLDYSTMERISKLPTSGRGWPRIREICVEPDDNTLKRQKDLIEQFERIHPKDINYEIITTRIKNLLKRRTKIGIENKVIYTYVIDQDGHACTEYGKILIDRIAKKFERDFLLLYRQNDIKALQDLAIAATSLYAKLPDCIRNYLKNILYSGNYNTFWNSVVNTVACCFATEKDIYFLFDVIANRIKNPWITQEHFPIQCIKSICMVLMYREHGYLGLTREYTELFASYGLERLQKQAQTKRYERLFFQIILFFLFLLRFRKKEPSSFSPNDKLFLVFEEVKKILENSYDYLINAWYIRSKEEKLHKIKEVIEGFDNYLYYKGSEESLLVLIDLAGGLS